MCSSTPSTEHPVVPSLLVAAVSTTTAVLVGVTVELYHTFRRLLLYVHPQHAATIEASSLNTRRDKDIVFESRGILISERAKEMLTLRGR